MIVRNCCKLRNDAWQVAAARVGLAVAKVVAKVAKVAKVVADAVVVADQAVVQVVAVGALNNLK